MTWTGPQQLFADDTGQVRSAAATRSPSPNSPGTRSARPLAVLRSDVDVTVSVRCARARGPIRQGESVTVVAGELVRVELELAADHPLHMANCAGAAPTSVVLNLEADAEF